MTMTDGFRFNLKTDKPRHRELVAPFFDAYMAVYDELQAAGQYPYNDSFIGRIPGIEGPDEHWAIYFLQVERSLRDMESKLAEAVADGCVPIAADDLSADEQVRYERLVQYGWYMNGEGFFEYAPGGRLTRFHSSLAVLPRGARTRGQLCSGKVLIKRKEH